MGAFNVGSIHLDFDPEMVTNLANPERPYYLDKCYSSGSNPLARYASGNEYELNEGSRPITFEKGEMVGYFEMGSTIVMIYEAGDEHKVHAEEGEKLVVG